MNLVLDDFRGRRVGILGMARSGLALARAAMDAGAEVLAFDDSETSLARAEEAGCRLGGLDDVAGLTAMVTSPGIPLTHPEPHPLVRACQAHGIPLTCDIDLFARAVKSSGHPLIAVTGTNGKSTTTALIHHLLQRFGIDAAIGGNIGAPVFDLPALRPGQAVVLEVSSFQLDLCHDLAPDIAVWLNLTPDHLDRHGDMAGYVAAKKRVFDGQTEGDWAIIGGDDGVAGRFALSAQRLSIGTGDGVDIAYDDQCLRVSGMEVDLGAAESLRGRHNAQNAAAAMAAVSRLVTRPAGDWQEAFASFPGLPHRMEVVARHGDVIFVNDSKATNPEAAAKSLGSYENIHWIAGGKAKPGGFQSLAPLMNRVSHAYAIGAASDELIIDLGDLAPFRRAERLEVATRSAFGSAVQSGHAVVLLAPACASFDQFSSFEERGDRFRSLARAIVDAEAAA